MNKNFGIKNIQFVPVPRPEHGLLGFASMQVGGLSLQNIGIHSVLRPNGDEKIRLVYPAKRVGDRYLWHFRPMTPELEEAMRLAIEKKMEELGYFKPA